MQRGFTNAAATQPLAQKGKSGFAEGKAMAETRKHPTDKPVAGTTKDTRTGLIN